MKQNYRTDVIFLDGSSVSTPCDTKELAYKELDDWQDYALKENDPIKHYLIQLYVWPDDEADATITTILDSEEE